MRRHRRLSRRGAKIQRRTIILSILGLFLVFSVGYAAFQTAITINVKGNIKKKVEPILATEFIEELAKTDSTLFNDGQGTNGNIRYTGSSTSVHNYICLSESDVATDHTACQDKHLYRIIGSFDDIKKTASDATGEKRVKVIKAAPYSEDYWDTSGSNNWARPATLNTTLNTTYYNTLSADAKGVIDSSLWYLGGNANTSVTAAQAYAFERGTTVPSGNPTTASGIFALMYPSDYGYASSTCKDGTVKNINSYDEGNCRETDWLWLNNSKNEWMLSPISSNSDYAFILYSSGFVGNYIVYNYSRVVRPTAHLKSSVTIDTEGRDGTASNPYVAKMPDDDSGGGDIPTPPTPTRTIDSTFVPQYYEYHTGSFVAVGDAADTTGWVQDSTELTGKNYFLGHDVEGGNVTANYACFVIDDTQYCMKASSDGSTFAANKGLLGTLKDAGTITCSYFNDSAAICSGGGLGGLNAYSDGNADAGSSNDVYCYAISYGYSICYE